MFSNMVDVDKNVRVLPIMVGCVVKKHKGPPMVDKVQAPAGGRSL